MNPLPALAAGFLIGSTASAQARPRSPSAFTANPSSRLSPAKGTRIVTDPHFIEAYGRNDVAADVILISHEHNDHNQVEAVKNGANVKQIRGLRS